MGGEGRSGTTLMRVILDTHPNIACGTESKIFIDDITIEAYNKLLELYAKHIKNFSPKNDPEEALSFAFQQMMNAFFTRFAQSKHKKRWAEKTPYNIKNIDFLLNIFDKNIKFIHMIRDGRDVFCSMRDTLWGFKDVSVAAKHWKNIIDIGREHRGHKYYIEVKYENLIANPEIELKKVFSFLHEPYRKSLFNFYEKEHDFSEDETSKSQVEKKLYPTSVNRWKNDLSTEELHRFYKVAGKTLEDLGYET